MHIPPQMLIVGALLGCSGEKTPEAAPVLGGAWRATDLHVHSAQGSNDTDGSTVADHVGVARDRGLALVVVTDHSNSAGSMDCGTGDVEDCPNQGPEFPARPAAAAASDDALQVVVGVEISPIASLETTTEPTGHIGCIPRPGDPFGDMESAIVDRPAGDVLGGDGVGWCKDAGGLAVVNHPFSIAGWIAYDWSSADYDALEIFNGGGRFDANDAQGVEAWLCDRARGVPTIAVGGSDTHRAHTDSPPTEILDQALGFPTTWVRSESASADSILGALAQGRVIVGDPRTVLRVIAGEGDTAVGPGEQLTIEGDQATLWVEALVPVAGMRLQVIEVREEDCVDDARWTTGDAPSYQPTFIYDAPLVSGEGVAEQLEIPDGVTAVVRVWPDEAPGLMGDGVAVAAPIAIVR